MKKIFLAILLILNTAAFARAATVTLLSDSVFLETHAFTNPPDHGEYYGPAYSGVPSYKSVSAFGTTGGQSYSGVGFLNRPSGDVTWAQANIDLGPGGGPGLSFIASTNIDWEFSVDEQLQIDLSFTTLPGTGSIGSIIITDNTTGLAVYSANVVATFSPLDSINNIVLQPGTTYALDVSMSAGQNMPLNPVDLEISWNASFVPEPATFLIFGLGGLALLRRRRA